MPRGRKKKSTPKEKKQYNTAIVYRGNHELRRYTVDAHGDKFHDLAKQYASQSSDRSIELVNN